MSANGRIKSRHRDRTVAAADADPRDIIKMVALLFEKDPVELEKLVESMMKDMKRGGKPTRLEIADVDRTIVAELLEI